MPGVTVSVLHTDCTRRVAEPRVQRRCAGVGRRTPCRWRQFGLCQRWHRTVWWRGRHAKAGPGTPDLRLHTGPILSKITFIKNNSGTVALSEGNISLSATLEYFPCMCCLIFFLWQARICVLPAMLLKHRGHQNGFQAGKARGT